MTIEEMKKRKRELGYTNRTIADKASLPLSTVQKIFSGATVSPRESTIRALEGVLGDHHVSYSFRSPASSTTFVRDASNAHLCDADSASSSTKRAGEFTLTDYLALPEEVRAELIDGVFYEMAAPTTIHQAISAYIHKALLDFVLVHKGTCYPFISPVDVQLDKDEKTVVQPDILVVCDRDKYKGGRILGAPDLVIEVLSPSTRKKDMQLKLYKYASAGVREYWMIDPSKKVIVQYDLEHLEHPALYSFDDTVPVLIWDGKCQVNFVQLTEAVSFLWDVQ